MNNKKAFVEELGNLCLKYSINDVVRMQYDDAREEVTVWREDLFGNMSQEQVNVALDSKARMVLDIFKRLV